MDELLYDSISTDILVSGRWLDRYIMSGIVFDPSDFHRVHQSVTVIV